MASEIESILDFRREAARLVARLARMLGPGHLEVAEDAAQEALLRALRTWPIHGIPEHPHAWLATVARNLALDALRRNRFTVNDYGQTEAAFEPELPDGFDDDELRMLFLCVHPSLSPEAQIALTLRTLGGLNTREVARALLSTEEAVSQRLVRAKRQLAEVKAHFELPSDGEFAARLETIRRVLYLMFNEGYTAHTGPDLVRSELCDEAILLAERLAEHRLGGEPATHALLALMYLHSSRLPARVGPEGDLRTLAEQDRTKWDQVRIRKGVLHFRASIGGDWLTTYHLEAVIATCHALSPSWEATDWKRVLGTYDDLVNLQPTPVIRLNRTIALGYAEGAEAALEALDLLEGDPALRRYYLFPATRAHFLVRSARIAEAKEAYVKALLLATNEAERKFLERRIRECDASEGWSG